MKPDLSQVLEEDFQGEPTGVEVEQESDDEPEVRPWDPEKIRVSTKNFSLRNILDMIDSEDLDLAPDFQRNQVWKLRQKSRLIESLLLQIPLPAFYFAEDGDGILRVVDGLQRLSSIHSYARLLAFPLRNLEYLEGEEEKRYNELSLPLQRRLLNAQIVVHVIDPKTPDEVKYDIFKRINTGGEPLNAMEIRHCMSKARSRAFLKRCTQSEQFKRATGGALDKHVRMQDREAVLRFCAFSMLEDGHSYEEFGSLERLLTWANTRLDSQSIISDDALDDLFVRFENAMRNAYRIFGIHAFRKWPFGADRLLPINRALFETWSVVLSRYSEDVLSPVTEAVQKEARSLMTRESEYLASISTATSDPKRVRIRFAEPERIMRRLVS